MTLLALDVGERRIGRLGYGHHDGRRSVSRPALVNREARAAGLVGARERVETHATGAKCLGELLAIGVEGSEGQSRGVFRAA